MRREERGERRGRRGEGRERREERRERREEERREEREGRREERGGRWRQNVSSLLLNLPGLVKCNRSLGWFEAETTCLCRTHSMIPTGKRRIYLILDIHIFHTYLIVRVQATVLALA